MEVRGRCHVCTVSVDLSTRAPFPVVCGRRLCRIGVEGERLVVPVLLARPEWLGVAEIARSAGLALGAATEVLARMARRGWVESRRERIRRRPWRRRTDYRLTDPGTRMALMLIGCAADMTSGAVR